MKKHLIAAAVAAAVAGPAAAQVTVYGIMDISAASVDNQRTGPGWAATPNERDLTDTGHGEGALSTSRLGFTGTEDLGGGLKVTFKLEYGLNDAANGAAITNNRESNLAISGGFGTIRVGRASTAIHGVVSGFSTGAANNTVGAIYTSANNNRPDGIRPHQVYQDNLIQYTSPVMNGFTFMVEAGKQDDETTAGAGAVTPNETSTVGASLRYSNGPLNLGMAYQAREQETAPGTNTTAFNAAITGFNGINLNSVIWGAATASGRSAGNLEQENKTQAYGASYNLGMATPFLLHTRVEVSNDGGTDNVMLEEADAKATEIGLRVPVSGAVNAWVSTYSGDVDYQQTGNRVDVKGYQIGATYSMSKRTTLYAIIGRGESSFNGNGAPATALDSETDMSAFGIRHTF